MVDPIDPVSVKLNAGLVAETPRVEPVGLTPEQRQSENGQTLSPAPISTAQDTAKPPIDRMPRPGFEVHIDGPTLRLYSEMRDPDTRRVMQRIPTGYQPKFDPPKDYTPTEFDT